MPLILPQLPQKAGTHLTEQWEPLNASSSAFCPSQTPFILMFPDCELAGCFTPGLAAGRGKAHSTSVLPREVAGERYQGEKQDYLLVFKARRPGFRSRDILGKGRAPDCVARQSPWKWLPEQSLHCPASGAARILLTHNKFPPAVQTCPCS